MNIPGLAALLVLLLPWSSLVDAQDSVTLPVTHPTVALESDNETCPPREVQQLVLDATDRDIRSTLLQVVASNVEPCDNKNYGRVAHCPAMSCRDIFEQSLAYPMSGDYWIQMYDANSVEVYCNMTKEVCRVTGYLGLQERCPASSCDEILESYPGMTSSYYWVNNTLGDAVEVYCDMMVHCCNSTGGWMRIAYLDMTDLTQSCPQGIPTGFNFREEYPTRACGRSCCAPEESVSSLFFSSNGISYSQTCGKVIGYQQGTTNGISNYIQDNSLTIDDIYMDGVSVTYGSSPRNHIWSFIATLADTDTESNHFCPCSFSSNPDAISIPPYVGNDYFCESGTSDIPAESTFYVDDPLWDGQGCPSTSSCCDFNTPPWFCKDLPSPTMDDIEIRVMANEHFNNEDIPIEIIEIYVK